MQQFPGALKFGVLSIQFIDYLHFYWKLQNEFLSWRGLHIKDGWTPSLPSHQAPRFFSPTARNQLPRQLQGGCQPTCHIMIQASNFCHIKIQASNFCHIMLQASNFCHIKIIHISNFCHKIIHKCCEYYVTHLTLVTLSCTVYTHLRNFVTTWYVHLHNFFVTLW